MPRVTLEQKRAAFAFKKVDNVRQTCAPKECEKYLTDLRHLPAQLHWGGLGQTAASLCADPKKGQRLAIYRWLEAWLRETRIYSAAGGPQPSLLQAITGDAPYQSLQERYVSATREARALAVWLKKFAEAFLRARDDREGGDDHAASSAPTAG